MSDIHSPEIRKRNMAAVKSRNTGIELAIRKGLYKAGFRYRLHDKNLPGTPDIVLKSYNAVIFINGCFWHGHQCHLFSWPKTNKEFWKHKISRNKENDAKNLALLRSQNWRTGLIYGCALKGKNRLPIDTLISQLTAWLKSEAESFEAV